MNVSIGSPAFSGGGDRKRISEVTNDTYEHLLHSYARSRADRACRNEPVDTPFSQKRPLCESQTGVLVVLGAIPFALVYACNAQLAV
jgi:hypothetical protein